MKIKRVLTIESIEDETSRKMLKLIYRSEEFKDYIIDHFFFLGENKIIIGQEELFNNLNNKIKKFKPDAVLIHLGGYFLKNKKAFLYVIPKLKTNYEKIRFGIQQNDSMDGSLVSILDHDEELKKLETLFFKVDR